MDKSMKKTQFENCPTAVVYALHEHAVEGRSTHADYVERLELEIMRRQKEN